jgi:phospholipid/cholesterol/gamma-HCH transport system permease protein
LAILLHQVFENTGQVTLFTKRFFKAIATQSFELKEFLKQCYLLGYKAFPLVGITGFIMGLVLTLQSRPTMVKFGAEAMLPGMVALSLVKEVAPIVTALICAGKISSGIGAELGSMKVTEQIDAMEVSAINPFNYLVVTRILATTLMVPLLVVFADCIGMFGGYLAMNIHSNVKIYRYTAQILETTGFIDILPATIKTVFFGFFVGMIGCFKGFNAANGTESVGRAANSAVVSASLSIFIIDLIAVQLTDILFKL